jgi:hypothetical protein
MSSQQDLDRFVAKLGADGSLSREDRDAVEEEADYSFQDLNVNLSYARFAISQLKRFGLGQVANWDERQPQSLEHTIQNPPLNRYSAESQRAHAAAVWGAETDADRCVYRTIRPMDAHPKKVEGLRDIYDIATLATQHKCGNCMELAARTFVLLHAMNIRPLDYVQLKGPADHSFVVIGRPRNAPILGGEVQPRDSKPWRHWGSNAAVCDPWALGYLRPSTNGRPGQPYGETYSAYDATLLDSYMGTMVTNFTTPVLAYREEYGFRPR